ncbi:esterase-like activity of phytase family protein [Pseudoduganella sp. UC29_106]|uniref:esterase-like activity of phytase family protein n=1 Tax=Pseudoduganella sp. UC29_106 TaxID=3374553 RepID=UPI003756F31E
MRNLVFAAAGLLLAGCAALPGPGAPAVASAGAAEYSVASLRFIGEQRIPLRMEVEGTTAGGFSGIDYDPASQTWFIESDDRSNINPARFYTAKLDYDAQAFRSVTLTGVRFFRQADGSVYPGPTKGGDVPDIETIRIDPLDGSIWYASEGDRRYGLNPWLRQATREGAFIGEMPLPENFKVWKDAQKGSRNNLSLEGLTFAPDGQSLWLSLEAPLYEDGPEPTPSHGAVTRITRFARDGRVLGQYAYEIDAIPAAPAPGKAADNGVSEILAVNSHEVLVLERAAVQGADGLYKNYIRVYAMDIDGATDVRDIPALVGARFTPARKRLVLDLNTLGLPALDNVEGISWGAVLENGRRSLVLISDDNFGAKQVTQLLLFEVRAAD